MSRYIDVDALKYYGNHIGDEYEDYFHETQWVYRSQIDDAPSLEPKRGEWLEWIDCEGEVFWKCSACGQVSEASAAGILYKFCPFCGADMRGADK